RLAEAANPAIDGMFLQLGNNTFGYGLSRGPIRGHNGNDGLHLLARDIGEQNFCYVNVASEYAYDVDEDFVVTMEYLAQGGECTVEYDSHDPEGVFDGAFTLAERVPLQNTGEWESLSVELPRARFANRMFGEADLRIGRTKGDELVIRKVTIKRKGE
ncbi:MAG: hypothetical protein J5758_05485, partial [Abditibacteriota bacterium]|nr:hypothetical protein [Abditibacteriota bacterium]